MCITTTKKHNHVDGLHKIPCNCASKFVWGHDNRNDSNDADDEGRDPL